MTVYTAPSGDIGPVSPASVRPSLASDLSPCMLLAVVRRIKNVNGMTEDYGDDNELDGKRVLE